MMQRKIKFRAWHKGDKDMSEFSFTNNLVAVDDKDNLVICSDSGGWSFYDEDLVLMQFTGLTDRNGKEIYEGDIIRAGGDVDGRPTSRVGVVTWIRTGYDLVLDGVAISYGFFDTFPMEVIGNIYENPELTGTASTFGGANTMTNDNEMSTQHIGMTERAREFIMSRTPYATESAAEMYARDFAEFARAEVAAEREAYRKVLGNALRFLTNEMIAEQDGHPVYRHEEWRDMVKQIRESLKEEHHAQ